MTALAAPAASPARRTLTGRRRALAAVALGALAALGLPPFHIVPLYVAGFALTLILLWRAETPGRAFRLGWCFAFGHHVAGLYWIANALLVEPDRFGWMVPFAALGLPAFLALFGGGVAWAAWRLFPRGGVVGALGFACLWSLAELVRGHVLTGFPWNLPASVWTAWPVAMQPAALVGAYGLSLLTLIAACLPAAWRGAGGRAACLAGGAVALALLGWSWARLPSGAAPVHPGVVLRLVQPNIPQREKWLGERRLENVRDHLRLSAGPGTPAAVIWPETAVPFTAEREPNLIAAFAEMLRATTPNGLLITGTPRLTGEGDARRIWNGMIALDAAGQVLATYDKFHLVPFGEYVPLRDVLPIGKITPGALDFSAGPGPRTLRLPGLPAVGPLICYEVIFPGAVVDASDPPDWLLNLTNDGWYGYSTGPFQHWATAAMRAVEQGAPVARVANTGISGMVDPWGRVVAQLGLEERGVIDTVLPRRLDRATLFSQIGNWAAWIGSVFGVILAAGLRTRKANGDHSHGNQRVDGAGV